MAIVESTKKVFAVALMPTVNMWCAHTLMLMKPMRDGRRDHHRIAEDRLARKYRNDFRGEGEGWDDEYVDFRMAEDPEEMHPDYGRAAGLRVEEMSAEVAVDQQHDLRRRQRTDREEHQACHHEVEPGEQRHLAQRHARAAHAKNGGDDIDRRSDAAEAGNQ